MAIRLIVNADDFGSSQAVNEAVAQAHAFAALTSASLMVTGEAFREAVDIARDTPTLAVGLHIALTRAGSVLPYDAVPALVDSQQRFPDEPVTAGLRYYFSSQARQHLALEIEAQFSAFVETGLTLSHVDGHQHMHAHPTALPIVLRLAEKYGAIGVRVPREPRRLRSMPVANLVATLGQAYLARSCGKVIRNTRLVTCDYCIGGMMSGQMTDDYVIRALERIDTGSIEAYFHPSTTPSAEPLGPNPGDLAALLSPTFLRFVRERCELSTYASLAGSEVSS